MTCTLNIAEVARRTGESEESVRSNCSMVEIEINQEGDLDFDLYRIRHMLPALERRLNAEPWNNQLTPRPTMPDWTQKVTAICAIVAIVVSIGTAVVVSIQAKTQNRKEVDQEFSERVGDLLISASTSGDPTDFENLDTIIGEMNAARGNMTKDGYKDIIDRICVGAQALCPDDGRILREQLLDRIPNIRSSCFQNPDRLGNICPTSEN